MTTIAIDGPGGAGKSTLGRALAARLGLPSLDTGAMYRSVALLGLRAGVDPSDEEALAALARSMSLDLGDVVVVLNGEDVTEEIRSDAVNEVVSVVARHPAVRVELVVRQRAFVETHGGGVVEGRDIGTVVLPDADVKIFLTASEDVRAARRAAERPSPGGSIEETRRAIGRRDELDTGRTASPLLPAADAILIDSSESTPDEIVQRVVDLLAKAP